MTNADRTGPASTGAPQPMRRGGSGGVWMLVGWLSVGCPALSGEPTSPRLSPPRVTAPKPIVLSKSQIRACAAATDDDPAPVDNYWSADTPLDAQIYTPSFSRTLCAMGETPLTRPARRGALRLRFLLVRSFHPAVAVRLERGSDGYARIVAIELDGPEGAAVPGPVKRRVERDLSYGEWLSLKKTVSQVRLWSLPTGETLDFIAMDGSTWLLEIADHERYHVVQRWSGRAVGRLGREMLSLARVDPKPMY